jgi:hypothetical protein
MTTIGNESRPAYVYDAETDTWVPIGVGPHTHDEYIDKTIINAKGDIIVGTALDSVSRLGVGLNGNLLIADSTATTGVAWSNTITTNETNVSTLIIKSIPSQSASLQRWENSSGTSLASVTATGAGLFSRIALNTGDNLAALGIVTLSAGTQIGQVIRGASSQTANLAEWQNSSGTVLSRIDSSGRFVGDGSQLTGINTDPNPQIFLLMGA